MYIYIYEWMYSVLLLSFNLKCVCGYAAAFGNSCVLRWESGNISNLVASVAEVSHFHSLSKLLFRYSASGGAN